MKDVHKLVDHVIKELTTEPSGSLKEIQEKFSILKNEKGDIENAFRQKLKIFEKNLEKKQVLKEIHKHWFRAIRPSQISTPLTYEGSKCSAQRFNFIGEETLYFGEDYNTCFKEIRFEESLCPTTTLSVDIKLQSILDISTEKLLNNLQLDSILMSGPWKRFNNIGIDFYTQFFAHIVRNGAFEGIMYESTVNEGQKCLAVFPLKLIKGSHLKVIKPTKEMTSETEISGII